MEPSPPPTPVASSSAEVDLLRGRLDQLEQLRASLQKALGHDLPNQLVAVQGLVKLLELEEGERLTEEGRDYLVRLAAAARRTHETILQLAQDCRAARETARKPDAGATPSP